MPLSYLVTHVPDHAAWQTERAVWNCATVDAAWGAVYAAYTRALPHDPYRALQLRQRDMTLLAQCTARADILHLLSLLPPPLRAEVLRGAPQAPATLEEVYVHTGQPVEVRGGENWCVALPLASHEDVAYVLHRVGPVGQDGRVCVAGTAHRVAAWRDRHGAVLGLTLRVGRVVPDAAAALVPLARRGSVLLVAAAGRGKTTLLRDLALTLAHDPGAPRVTVVDTSNEICGDAAAPLGWVGRCRRLQVAARDGQGRALLEAIQNHTAEVVVVDELTTLEEAQAARTASLRGVRLVASCHGATLAALVQNHELNLLVGGSAQAFLSNEERRLRNKTRKTVLERPFASPFDFVVELQTRTRAFVYVNVEAAVDLYLDGQDAQRDARVGVAIDLTQPPSERLVALLQRRRTPIRAVADAPPPPPPVQDDEGYLVTAPS